MSALQRLSINSRAFLIDYIGRHKHPVNAGLHLVGVPMVFFGIFKLFGGRPAAGMTFFVLGYYFQYLGHKVQGNEVGEVTLIKKIWRSWQEKRKAEQQ